jgi:hypothetical protein
MKHGEVLVDAAHGEHTPRVFCILYGVEWGLDAITTETLLAGPEEPGYGFLWEQVIEESRSRPLWLIEHKQPPGRHVVSSDAYPSGLLVLDPLRMTLEEQAAHMPFNSSPYDFVVGENEQVFVLGATLAELLAGYASSEDVSAEDTEDYKAFKSRYGDAVRDVLQWDEFGRCEFTSKRGPTSIIVIGESSNV